MKDATYIEKREYPRLNKSLPVKITLQDKGVSRLLYDGIGRNLSRSGMFIDSRTAKIELGPGRNLISLEISLPDANLAIRAVADVVWTKRGEGEENSLFLGAKFKEVSELDRFENYVSELFKEEKLEISSIIAKRLHLKPDTDGLPKFSPLVNGEDVDTGVYRYYPYAEKVIDESRMILEITSKLKKGKTPENYKDYIFAKYCVADKSLNQKAIQAAHNAFKIFSKLSLESRRKIVEDIIDSVVANREILIELLVLEGHTRSLAEWQLWGIERAFKNRNTLEFFKGEMWKSFSEKEESIYLARRPDGVVCLSPPQNAPASNSLLAVMTFLAGNALIVKPPLHNPISTIFLWRNIVYEALMRNGAPAGTLNIIVGNSKKIMDEWIDNPLVNDIIFFGESDKGLDIASRAFNKGKKPILELAGNDMLFVWRDVPVQRTVDAFMDCFLGSTQICMLPKKAVIHEEIFDEFLELFIMKTKQLKPGFPSDYKTDLIPVAKMDECFNFLNDALQKGAKLIYGGERINVKGEPDKDGMFVKPAILLVEDKDAKELLCIREENYFPVIPLVRVKAGDEGVSDKDEAIFKKMVDLANSNQYGLRISAWVRSEKYIKRFMEEMGNSGLLRINSRHISFSAYLSSHGGPRRTGGPYGEMNYIWMKTSHLQGISKFDLKDE